MLIEESRVFQVATFGALQLHQSELDQSQVLLDVMVIADEVDAHLTEAVRTLMRSETSTDRSLELSAAQLTYRIAQRL